MMIQDPTCILLLQLSSLLVEHAAPHIHDSNNKLVHYKYCVMVETGRVIWVKGHLGRVLNDPAILSNITVTRKYRDVPRLEGWLHKGILNLQSFNIYARIVSRIPCRHFVLCFE